MNGIKEHIMETPELEEKLNQLTRKQRKIYEIHLDLFDAIFNHPILRHYDPDLLEILLIEQKEYLINQLIISKSHEYKYMTIKGVQEDVKRSIAHNLDELVEVVVDIIKDLENIKA
jgi:hypothetical protein